MNRRHFLGATGVTAAAGRLAGAPERRPILSSCDCALAPQAATPAGAAALAAFGSKMRITNVKTFGVTIPGAPPDRPYVFVKLETNEGLVGWGEGTLEGKAGSVLACINDFREFLIGADPMPVEHHWQSMYVHSFYRAGPVIGSAISAIDQALWDLRGKILGVPVYRLLGGPNDPEGVRGYYIANARTLEQLKELRATAHAQGITAFKAGLPTYYEWIETNEKISQAIRHLQNLREGLGPDIDIGVDFHAKTSPSVAAVIIKEADPLRLLRGGAVPSGKRQSHGADCAARPDADRHRRTACGGVQRARARGAGCCGHHSDGHEPRGRHHRALESSGHSQRIVDHDRAACVRGPHRHAGLASRRRLDSELPDPGVLRAGRTPDAR
jgi:galactonate dehydratase